ncbi:MAG: hypothetical protein WDN45_03625 [Caulobacteraceae bacterium]
MVVVDGFARFGRAADFPQGVAGRVLDRMKARMGDGVLAEFVRRAGGELPEGEPDRAALIEGLERLHGLDGRACRLPCGGCMPRATLSPPWPWPTPRSRG